MTVSKRVFVLVGDEQVPVSPSDVAGAVLETGFAGAAEKYGYGESTLRKFLAENGIRSRRVTTFERSAPDNGLAPENQEALDTAVEVITQLGG